MGDNKKVYQIDLIPQEQLLAVISGRNRHVRLIPTQALDGREADSNKLTETKNCQTIVSGPVRNGALTCLCVAMKSKIICYEVRKTPSMDLPGAPRQYIIIHLLGLSICKGVVQII